MKKLITLTFVITALLLGAVAIHAQPSKKGKYKNPQVIDNISYNNVGYSFRGVHTYYTTKNVLKYGQLYKNTYKVNVFRNGRKNTTLISSVPIHSNYGKKVFYQTQIVQNGWKTYRVTYKIVRFPNGRVKKEVVKKVRIYNKVNW